MKIYSDFKSGRYMGWKVRQGNSLNAIPHPHLACLRQIAHEALLTLEECAAEQFKTKYVYPEKPIDDKPGVLLFGNQVEGPASTMVPVLRFGNTELIGEVSPGPPSGP